MSKWLEILLNLLDIKSIVTVALTVIFGYLLINEKLAPEFMTVYSMVITFYFTNKTDAGLGTQVANILSRNKNAD